MRNKNFINLLLIIILNLIIVNCKKENQLLKLTTNAVTNIHPFSALCGGIITSNGSSEITSQGVCWSTNPSPTINDNKTTYDLGMNSFTSKLTNLDSKKTYYVRAYAINSVGISYGDNVSFVTLPA